MNGAEQQQSDEAWKSPVDRLPRWKILGQHASAAARPSHVADRVEDLAQVHASSTATPWRRRQQRRDPRPLLVRHVRRVALDARFNPRHPGARFVRPHNEFESQNRPHLNLFSNRLSLLWKDVLWAKFTTGAPRRLRRSVERYSASLRVLSKHYGVNQKTVAKWKRLPEVEGDKPVRKKFNAYEFICKTRTTEPDWFRLNPIHQMTSLNS